MRTVRRHYRAVTVLAALILAIALFGCASGGPRHIATVSVVSAHGVLSFLQDGEALLVCGKSGAPAAPQCVPAELHRTIAAEFVTAFDIDGRVALIAKTLPADVPALLAQLDAIIARILRLLPSSPQKDALVTRMIGS